MKREESAEQYSPEEIERRRDALLLRLLKTPQPPRAKPRKQA